MENSIVRHIREPEALERLYRNDPKGFRKSFEESYRDIASEPAVAFWKARLNHGNPVTGWGDRKDILVLAVLAAVAAFIVKIPHLFGVDEETYYSRNLGFIAFPGLAAWFIHASGASMKKSLAVSISMLLSLLWINLLPKDTKSDTLVLACLHLPLFLWSMTSMVFTEGETDRLSDRRGYLKYSGDLVVMGTLLGLAGFIMTGVTIGLFQLIGLDIGETYARNVAIPLFATLPLVSTWLVRSNPALVGRVSPVIARVFAPLVLITLFAFLLAFIGQGKDPFNDREFLVLFNGLLIGVLAIVFFSLTEASREEGGRFRYGILFGLSALTLVVNGIALSAISYRMFSMGLTPNRLAVTGANLLMFVNLAWIAYDLWMTMGGRSRKSPDRSIAAFLPWYAGWTAVVVFLFPILFSNR
jgi:hypothetical protein